MLRAPLAVEVRLYLVDGGDDIVIRDEVEQLARLEVCDTYRAYLPALKVFFKHAPSGIIVCKRPVQHQQVDIIRLQIAQRLLYRLRRVFIVLVVYLRDKKQLITRRAAKHERAKA